MTEERDVQIERLHAIERQNIKVRRAECDYAEAKATAKECKEAWEESVQLLSNLIDDEPKLPLVDGSDPE